MAAGLNPDLAPPGRHLPGPGAPGGGPPLILLAPMEGLLDYPLREVLTALGGMDRCVSEFIRVTDRLLPERVFTRVVPELLQGSRTKAGVPVRPQLLGSDPACLADNAARLAALGAEGVDLNFGCPAKTVNRHRGGAVLLDEPELLHAIVAAVRRAVPAAVPVSAKMRLGHRDSARRVACAQALAAGGVAEIVVHARTKLDAYRPPAHWAQVADIRSAVAVPVLANGEIWTVADAQRARAESGCRHLMLGRGLVADPGLAWALRAHDGVDGRADDAAHRGPAGGLASPAAGCAARQLGWPEVAAWLPRLWQMVAQRTAPRHRAGRIKQWLFLLRRRHPEAALLFDRVRGLSDPQAVDRLLQQAAAAALTSPGCPSAPWPG